MRGRLQLADGIRKRSRGVGGGAERLGIELHPDDGSGPEDLQRRTVQTVEASGDDVLYRRRDSQRFWFERERVTRTVAPHRAGLDQ